MCVCVCTNAMNHCQRAEPWKDVEYNEFNNFGFSVLVHWLSSEQVYKDFLFCQFYFKISWKKKTSPFNNERKKVAVPFNFLINIILHINVLNLKLQGKERLFYDIAREPYQFTLQLKFFIVEINNKVLTYFSNINQYAENSL